jgi:hypothetical protein
VAVDIDAHPGDPADPAANLAAALAWYSRSRALGFRPLLTASNGRGGYHLVVVFRVPLPAALAHAFLRWLTDDHVVHGLARRPEHFPKKPLLTGKRFGNWLRLPGAHHSRPHWSLVWDSDRWLGGAEAVALLLGLDGDDPALIPAEVVPTEPEPPRAPRPRTKTAPAPRAVRPVRAGVRGDLPGNLLNSLGTWSEILEPAGWKFAYKAGDVEHWTRPGKDGGTSATIGFCHTAHAGSKLYVFTSNAPPFEPGQTYSRFAAFALLHHGGDYRAAAAALARRFGVKLLPLSPEPSAPNRSGPSPRRRRGGRPRGTRTLEFTVAVTAEEVSAHEEI